MDIAILINQYLTYYLPEGLGSLLEAAAGSLLAMDCQLTTFGFVGVDAGLALLPLDAAAIAAWTDEMEAEGLSVLFTEIKTVK